MLTFLFIAELIDNEIDEEKDILFASIISKLEIIVTHGKSLCTISELCTSYNSISELYLDFDHKDYTKDLKKLFTNYQGSNLKVLEISRMDDPIELDTLSEACPNLNKLKIMLCGIWQDDKLFWMYFSRLTTLHIKTSSTETLLSFMQYNISVNHMKVSCPNEVKSKFNDVFIQTACSRKGFLPSLKTLIFCSKFPFGFQSAQRLIENLSSLQYIGPMEMFSKLSKRDVLDLVKWIRDHNWDIVIEFKAVEYNVFEIDLSDPWKHKFIPDVGRIPVRKTSAPKRVLSVSGSGYSEDDEDVSSSSDGRKRSRLTSLMYPSPSQATTTRVGSLKKSIDHEITEFEFEFCLDSDGFIKNKDYRVPNYQLKSKTEPKTTDDPLDEYYTDYDSEFDEDTMDVEDIPEDADFEWCWDEEGRLRIDEIEKEESPRLSVKEDEKQALPDEIIHGVTLDENEKISLEMAETELSLSSGKVDNFILVDKKKKERKTESIFNDKSCVIAEQFESDGKMEDRNKKSVDKLVSDRLPVPMAPDPEDTCQSRLTDSQAVANNTETEAGPSESSQDLQSSSSRRAQKRVAQITPPPVTCDAKKETDALSSKISENNSNFRSSIIPPKASKPDSQKPAPAPSDNPKTSKIASMFERPNESNNTNNMNLNRNKSSSNVFGMAQNKPKTLDIKPKAAAAPVPKTQVIEVFEYDPLLGYCTVKRKTVPISEVVPDTVQSPSVSANLSFLNTSPTENDSEKQSTKEEIIEERVNSPEHNEAVDVSESQNDNEKSYGDNENASSSGTSSKENKAPNKNASEVPMSGIPLSSMSKYDIPFLNNILGQKAIPEPPKSKPPKLPKSVDSKLPMPRVSGTTPATNDHKKEAPKKDNTTKTDIKIKVEEEINVNVTMTKLPEKIEEKVPIQKEVQEKKKEDKSENAAREWYWDYDKNCWQECDPDEEYEWEYIDDDDNDNKNNSTNQEIQATVKLTDKSKKNSVESGSVDSKDRKADLSKDESKF